jgi:7-carboxy-7-deazaguanine synthase (Cx14CxxC type)
MHYVVKELFYTLQGEGCNAGRPAVFCRFAGCNLWTGREEDRATAVCSFCDTDFVGTHGPGGGIFETACELAVAALNLWPGAQADVPPFVVFTGGEPLLQLDEALVDEFHRAGFVIAVETNGTHPAPRGLDWVCVSPKAGADLVLKEGDELKLVYPQEGARPEEYENFGFRHFLLSPMSGPELARNTRLALEYCLTHPRWRLTLQLHKLLGIP